MDTDRRTVDSERRYELAVQLTGADQYTVFYLDNSGNYLSDPIGTMLGESSQLETFQTSFQYDLNGDGRIGLPPPTVIGSFGSTTLFQSGSTGQLTATLDAAGGAGRVITWSGAEFQGFRHAGAIYKDQGKTLDRMYLYHTEHWRSAARDVALTRQRESAQLFVARETARDVGQLAQHMARGEVKATSVARATQEELAKQPSVSHRRRNARRKNGRKQNHGGLNSPKRVNERGTR